MSECSVSIQDVGKLYRLYNNPADKVLDIIGVNRLLFWKRNYYEDFWALRGVDLKVSKGEQLGIIGRNGAGKSTLLKIISGIVTPTEGYVNVQGKIQALMELGTGFHPEFTGRQNIRVSLSYHGFTKEEIRQKEIEIIEFTELEDFIDHPTKTYSSGMYTRLAFSTATSIEPDILIIDEILGAGDAYFMGKCTERMKKLTDESGATVIFVSHDLPAVQSMCERVIWLNRGRITMDGDPVDVTRAYYQEVQEEENLRLRARLQGISKKEAFSVRQVDTHRHLLFHLSTVDREHPQAVHRIRKIRLFDGKRRLNEIEVGAAADNSPSETCRILSENGYSDWGEPDRDEKGFFRCYRNMKGRYGFAPFEFMVPLKSESGKKGKLRLEIEADIDSEEDLCLELFGKEGYTRLGMMTAANRSSIYAFEFDLKSVDQPMDNHMDASGDDSIYTYPFSFLIESDKDSDFPLVACVRFISDEFSDAVNMDHTDSERIQINKEGWGKLEEINNRMCRPALPLEGGKAHIQFSVKEKDVSFFQKYRMEVDAVPGKKGACRVCVNYKNQDIPIGEILPEDKEDVKTYTFRLDIVCNLGKTDSHKSRAVIESGHKEAWIEQLTFFDGNMKPVTGIEEGGALIVQVKYDTSICVKKPEFGMTVYRIDGTCICHANTALADSRIEEIEGKGYVRFIFSPFYGGPGEYLLSTSIFKYLDPASKVQPPFYDQHDRAYRFRVWKRFGLGMNIGLLRNPYTIEHSQENGYEG